MNLQLKLLKLKIKFKYFNFRPIILDLIKWKLIDTYRLFKLKDKPVHLYGIRCLCGMYGQGKTTAMTYEAFRLRNKYGDRVYICSNYGLTFQDFPFISIDQISKHYDKPIVFFWDEVQNDFPATDKVFPKEVRQALTLNRKGNGKMFYWASQDHELVHKTIRRLTIEYGEVKTLLKRLTRIRWYKKLDYEALFEQLDIDKRRKIHPFRVDKFIQDDVLRAQFKSFQVDNGEKLL